ncbi:DUF6492 family protein [Pleomorphomonas sp. T1.2MG-36]|uniref:DUF6492 family protein n=1 Tax=Pleomorphomonas sp. T1.2MG-36 TaxID=3041167 RepID=UPI0025412272|nr:DUF6492 family protein [Pleomorphomonas sp. T1.2MG-36]
MYEIRQNFRGHAMNNLITICSKADVDTWMHCAPLILERIESDRYILIVPDREIPIFKFCTPERFEIIPESRLSSAFHQKLKNSIPSSNSNRFGWYLQQFLKISALIDCSDDEISLIWDADTLPLRSLVFESKERDLLFFRGREEHKPYFDCIKSLLGLEKIVSSSFVAQCFPIRGRWIKDFVAEVEERFGKAWYDALIDVIDFSESSGFSEYETLGTYISHRYPDQFRFVDKPWCRRGYKAIGDISNIDSVIAKLILYRYDYISFEKWDKENQATRMNIPPSAFGINKFLTSLKWGRKNRKRRPQVRGVDEFLRWFFSKDGNKHIVQVGANDGLQSDPLRPYLVSPGEYTATLIEPIPYYVDRLKQLYSNRDDIRIEKCAVGDKIGEMTLYYIPPEIADQMNGEGPENNWAHGQGSFDRSIIDYWIRRNSFRGEEYRRKIDFFISKITSETVPVRCVSDFQVSSGEMLLCVDAQGFEMSVLRGVDWSSPPSFIMFEDDREGDGGVADFLRSKDYSYVCGHHDKVYVWLG